MPRTIVARALRAARLATVLMTTALTGYGVCAAPAAIRADDTATWPLIVTADRAEDCAQTLTAAQHADNIAGLEERQRPANKALRRDVQHAGSV